MAKMGRFLIATKYGFVYKSERYGDYGQDSDIEMACVFNSKTALKKVADELLKIGEFKEYRILQIVD